MKRDRGANLTVRPLILCLVSLVLTLWLGSCSDPPPTEAVSLNFGATGIVRGALEEIEQLYQQEHPNIVFNRIFAASYSLKAAIEQGEAFDGILLADVSPLDSLQAQGFIQPDSRKVLLTTDIVAIARVDSPIQLSDFRELASDRIKTIAMGGKKPLVGKYTREILNRLGIARIVEPKAILVQVDVREVLKAVELEEAEVGLTFLPEAKISTKVKVLATAPRDLYQPIRSCVAVIKTSAHAQEMQAYLDFLSSNRASAVFQKFGLRPLGV